MNIAERLILAAAIVFLLNLPFGYWRAGLRRFSPMWFVAVHAPVPGVVGMRFLLELGFAWFTYPVLIAAYFAGQFAGARLGRRRGRRPIPKDADQNTALEGGLN